uniref:G protein-coupled receptor n=1 Tax=Pristionchus pacificus TaxID=54126 RepID=A0A8R1UUK9_PRIPA
MKIFPFTAILLNKAVKGNIIHGKCDTKISSTCRSALLSMNMIACERFAATRNFRTYESSRRNTIYFSAHLLAYDFGGKYAVVPNSPNYYGEIWLGVRGPPVGLVEMLTIATFEYLYWLNRNRLHNTTFTLTERYKIAENIRMLEILRPIAKFHGVLTSYGVVCFLFFRQNLENGPTYPIFEECINLLILQGISLPIFFMRHERKVMAHENLSILMRYSSFDSIIPPSILSYDFGGKYAVTTLVPERGQIYHQIIGAPFQLLEMLTIATFEYLYRLNRNRLQKTTYNLSERYQIAENIRVLEILRPIAKLFHGSLSIYGGVSFILFGRKLENEPSYPIFEECINFLLVQGIVLPIVFIRHERCSILVLKGTFAESSADQGKQHNARRFCGSLQCSNNQRMRFVVKKKVLQTTNVLIESVAPIIGSLTVYPVQLYLLVVFPRMMTGIRVAYLLSLKNIAHIIAELTQPCTNCCRFHPSQLGASRFIGEKSKAIKCIHNCFRDA